MAWVFDAQTIDIVWTEKVDSFTFVDSVTVDLGTGDLSIDTGQRSATESTLDQGMRVLDNGNI